MLPNSKSVVVLLYPGCTIAEIVEVATRVESSGSRLIYASPDGQPLADQSGLQMTPDFSVADIDAATVDAVVIPGGDTTSIMGNAAVKSLLEAVATSGGVLAGICAGVLVLADAGLLVDRQVTHNYRAPWSPIELNEFVRPYFARVSVEEDRRVGVVVDGAIITALPNATSEFAMTVLRELGLVDTGRAELLRRHLNGEFVVELFMEVSDE